MDTDTLMTEGLKKLIVPQSEVLIYRVEEGAIIRYAQAIGDPNPLFNDPEYARNSRYGRIICPPGFFGWAQKYDELPGMAMMEKLKAAGAPAGLLDGGVNYEFFFPVGAGDTLTYTSNVEDLAERDTKMGRTLILTVRSRYVNQNGDVVCETTSSCMFFRI